MPDFAKFAVRQCTVPAGRDRIAITILSTGYTGRSKVHTKKGLYRQRPDPDDAFPGRLNRPARHQASKTVFCRLIV